MTSDTAMIQPLLLLASSLPCAEPDRLLAAVPADAVLVVVTDEWDALRERASTSRWVAFLQDEQWRSLWEAANASEEVRALLEHRAEVSAALASVHGRVVAFAAGADPERVAAGVLVEPGEDRAAFEEIYDDLLERLSAERTPGYGDYGDVELTFFEDEDGDTQVHFELDSVFGQVVAPSSEAAVAAVHGVVDRYQGHDDAAEGFDADALAGGARQGLPADPAFWALLDVQRFLGLIEGGEDGLLLEPQQRETLERVGVFGIGWAYLQAELGAGEELGLRMRLALPQGTLLGDLLAELGPLPTEMLSLMPNGSTSVMLGSYDLWGAYSAVKAFLAEHAPEQHMQLDGALTMLKASMQIDLEGDLLSQLAGTFGGFQMPITNDELRAVNPLVPEDVEGLNQGDVTLVGLEGSERVQALVAKGLQLAKLDAVVEAKEFQGRPFFELAIPDGLRLQWAFTGGALAITAYPTPLRAVLARSGEGDAPTIRDDEAFAARIAALRDTSMLQIADTSTTVAMLLEVLPLVGRLGLEEGDVDEELAEAIAAIEWPDPALAREYFSGTVESTLARRGTVLEVVYAAR